MRTDVVRSFVAMVLCVTIGTLLPRTALPQPPSKESAQAFQKRTKWWREAKFGLFIHWGLYAVPADSTQGLAEWYFSNHTETDPKTGKARRLQLAEYREFAKRFNPVNFDAKAWVSLAKQAGMRYIVITSKHHDGFAMFHSLVSPYNIVDATPFGRDVIKELAEECKRQGIRLCFYHSIMDWNHPDYTPRRDWEANTRPATGANYDRYVEYMKAQLKELLTNYGKIGVLWFDGEWESTWDHKRATDLYNYVKSLQPDILINNRIDKGRAGMAGMNVSQEYLGDFGTPEQEIPSTGFADGRLWESCMTMNDTWGYARNDHNWKSATVLIRQLADIAGKGGNLLLNVGPTDLGEFTPETQDRLRALANWMKGNSKAIYGTEPNPFRKLSFSGTATRKKNHIYLFVYLWGDDSTVGLTNEKGRIRGARVLATGEKLQVTPLPNGEIRISKPHKIDRDATVVELTIDTH